MSTGLYLTTNNILKLLTNFHFAKANNIVFAIILLGPILICAELVVQVTKKKVSKLRGSWN